MNTQDVTMDGGQKAHVASVNDSEGHSVAVPDQLGWGSCTTDRGFQVHASERDYQDTWKHGEALRAALQGS